MQKNKQKIGLVGLGYVGGTLKHWFENQKNKYELFLYDKFKNIGSPDEINKADIVFIAVPTPFHEKSASPAQGRPSGYDDSAVLDALSKVKNGKTVVIKSTVLPGSTRAFQKKYPKKIILFNPEFLRAKTALKDFLKPDKQLIGYASPQGRKIAPEILKLLPKAPYSKIMPAVEAEMVKYFNNTYLAARVTFANQMYDLCQKIGADYSTVKDCVVQDKRIGNSHFDIFHDGYRGYGGLCLPKDTKAILGLAKKLNLNFNPLQASDRFNDTIKRQKQ